MGLATLRLITDTDADPRELLAGFSLDDGFPLAVLDQSETRLPEPQLWGYVCETDCSLTVYCSECGDPMCAGCGDAPLIEIYDGAAAAYCKKHRKHAAHRAR